MQNAGSKIQKLKVRFIDKGAGGLGAKVEPGCGGQFETRGKAIRGAAERFRSFEKFFIWHGKWNELFVSHALIC